MSQPVLYRNSRQRQCVWDAVVQSGIHPTADWVYQTLRKEHPSISLGTVYRNLDVLCKMGKLARVGCSEGPEAFDRNPSPHYHLICQQCGAIVDLPLAYMDALNEQARQAGYRITGHRILFEGLCEACAHAVAD